ncbi:hypothetical protein CI238_12940 [Colletotrichum incanum]|uniref:Uncharacterized protein n=1 Tax=Colletotrichum incanum TaxID=1573173 RepID=A0A161Y7I5_COLIC|nr:hypothetical protein CI238_12940 [Colletotrichum incanum]OHW97695.1 LysM domain-containing protein [Colletotrichum incanum]
MDPRPRIPIVDDVFAVRDDQDGRQSEFIDQPFKLNIAYLSSTSVCFRLSVTITHGDSSKIPIYLQITSDHIASLRYGFCKENDESSPYLDKMRKQLGGKHEITRLQFHLHNGVHAQLIVPMWFAGHEALDSPARRTFCLVASLAAASSFSLCLPHNLGKKLLNQCVQAVRCFPKSTEDELQLYRRSVDLQRLYNGNGGMAFAPGDRDSRPRSEWERNRSPTPATTGSCATTVDFDIVPRCQPSPPQYGECLDEGQKHTAISDSGPNFIESPTIDCAPPEYSDTELLRNAPASKRVRPCGNDDIHPHPSSKRILLQCSNATGFTTAATRNVPRLEAKSGPDFDDADVDGSMVFRDLVLRLQQRLEQQEEQMKRLQEEVENLRWRNIELERLSREVEDTCDEIKNRQDKTEEIVDYLLVHTGELDEECEKLGKQMPDISDEVQDWVKDNMGDLMKEYMDKGCERSVAGPLREYVRQIVKTHVAKMKAEMCKALQD